MLIVNPVYLDAIQAYVASHKAAIQTWLNSRPTNQHYLTPDEIRAAFPAEAAFLTDGTIAEIAKALGIRVE